MPYLADTYINSHHSDDYIQECLRAINTMLKRSKYIPPMKFVVEKKEPITPSNMNFME